jgi:transcriptional regulator with XRE-family HTH domain
MSDRPVINPSFRRALDRALDEIRRRYEEDWRSLAIRLGLTESLLSLYRSGGRYPSWESTLQIEKVAPGFLQRLTTLFYEEQVREGSLADGRSVR